MGSEYFYLRTFGYFVLIVWLAFLGEDRGLIRGNQIRVAKGFWRSGKMKKQTHFVIFKSDSQYSITECGGSGVKQAFMNEGKVSGDGSVLLRLSRILPVNEKLESFVEKNVGHLIYSDRQ